MGTLGWCGCTVGSTGRYPVVREAGAHQAIVQGPVDGFKHEGDSLIYLYKSPDSCLRRIGEKQEDMQGNQLGG